RWLAMGGLEAKFWAGFCERLDLPETATEDQVRSRIRTRTHDEWLAHFDGADVCLTTIYRPEEVAADPHIVARAAMPGAAGRPAPAPRKPRRPWRPARPAAPRGPRRPRTPPPRASRASGRRR